MQVARHGKDVYVQITGRGSFQNASHVKNFCEEMIKSGSENFLIDLKECTYLDSTFLGTLAGIGLKLRSAGHGTLVRALSTAGINPSTGVEVLNQQPQVGASALESGQAQALSQFVAWPGLLVYQGKANSSIQQRCCQPERLRQSI